MQNSIYRSKTKRLLNPVSTGFRIPRFYSDQKSEVHFTGRIGALLTEKNFSHPVARANPVCDSADESQSEETIDDTHQRIVEAVP